MYLVLNQSQRRHQTTSKLKPLIINFIIILIIKFSFYNENDFIPLFWFGLDKCQVPALSLPLLKWTGERKYDERLVGQEKDRERSVTNYCHGRNRLNLARKGSLIYHQSNQSGIVRNKIKS